MHLIDFNGKIISVKTPEEEFEELQAMIASCSPEEREVLEQALAELDNGGESEILDVLESVHYSERPVSPKTFYSDPYYFGEVCTGTYKPLIENLIEMFEGDYYEAIISGGVGTGKSTYCALAIPYMVYQIYCLANPQRQLGLMDGKNIAFGVLSVDLQQVRRGIFADIIANLESSPYFKQLGYKVSAGVIDFPKNISIITASPGSPGLLGRNVYGGALDEANFYEGKRSARADKGVAYQQYTALLSRIRSRFTGTGIKPGIMILASSKNVVGSFTDERVKAARDSKNKIMVKEYAKWELIPEQYPKERFYVLVGDDQCSNRILTNDEVEHVRKEISGPDRFAKIVPVPDHPFLRQVFENDLDLAIRDHAGVSTMPTKTFIGRRDKIDNCFKQGLYHPFTVETWACGESGDFEWHLLCRQAERRLKGGYKEKVYIPHINPNAPRHAHIDLSAGRQDPAGICVGHISRWIDVVKLAPDGTEYIEYSPEIYIDFIMQVIAPKNGEITPGALRALIYDLKAHGFNIVHCTTDSYHHLETRQKFEERGIKHSLISGESGKSRALERIKAAIYEDRLIVYPYSPLRRELINLELDPNTGIIDHPNLNIDGTEGHDDLAVSASGVVCSLVENPPSRPMGIISGSFSREEYEDDSWVIGVRNPSNRTKREPFQQPIIFGFDE